MADGSIQVTPGAGAAMRALTNTGVQAGAFQQVVSLGGPDGALSPFDPDGTLQVSPEPTTLMLDDFGGIIGTQHVTGGTAAPSANSGVGNYVVGTTASASSFTRSVGGFMLRAGTFLLIAHIIQVDAAAITNNTRWWGYGSNASTPTYATPINNACVFQLEGTSGTLQAVVFSNTNRTVIATLTRPTDGLNHRYEVRYRQSIVYWVIDGVTVASTRFPNLFVATGLYSIIGSFNNSTAPSASPTLNVSSESVADLGGNNRTISDGISPYIQASVKGPSIGASTTDSSLVVSLRESLPQGGNRLGSIILTDGTNFATVTGASATAPSTASAIVNTMHPLSPGVLFRAPTTPAARGTVGASTNALADAEGKTIIAGTAEPALTFQANATQTSTTAAALRVAAAAGIRNYITDLSVSNASATAVLAIVLDGATVMWQQWIGAGANLSMNFSTPLRGTAATAVNVNLSTAVTSVYFSATGYTGI